MDKSLLIFIAVGVAFIYFITNFVSDIQKEDETFRNSGYEQKQQSDMYLSEDSIGRTIIDFTDTDVKLPLLTQVNIWNKSKLKDEFLSNFPNFSLMKLFVKERVRGEAFQEKLLKHVDNVELEYFSGKLNSEEAKKKLANLR